MQSDSMEWFQYRRGRITASHCKRVASFKATSSPTKALRDFLSYDQVPQTTAIHEGLEREDHIEKALLKHTEQNQWTSCYKKRKIWFCHKQDPWTYWGLSR